MNVTSEGFENLIALSNIFLVSKVIFFARDRTFDQLKVTMKSLEIISSLQCSNILF